MLDPIEYTGSAELSDLELRQARNEHLRFHSWPFDLRKLVDLMQAEKGKNKHDDDDQTDEVNYSIHDRPPTGGRSGRSGRPPNK
jgi:hypothetical protein